MKKHLFACAMIAFTLAAMTATARPPMEAAGIHCPHTGIKAFKVSPIDIVGATVFVNQHLAVIDMLFIADEQFTNSVMDQMVPAVLSQSIVCYIPYWQSYSTGSTYPSFNFKYLSPTLKGSSPLTLRC